MKKLQEMSQEELIEEVKRIRSSKKYGLLWEEKSEDVVEQCKTQLPVLKEVAKKHIDSSSEIKTSYIIEGDNFHALSVLNYTHKGKVDIVYIDPPYNTGAQDWKYNNNYVDDTDAYRHSKWLSMMSHRLRVTRNVIKDDGVLIVTIDEHEVHNLGILLREMFPDAQVQMVTIVINPKGVTQGRFSRVEEHAFYVFFGNSKVYSVGDDLLSIQTGNEEDIGLEPRWKGLLRSGTNASREDRKNMFYPVFIDPEKGTVEGAGESLEYPIKPDLNQKINDRTVVWPIRSDGSEGRWSIGGAKLIELTKMGYVKLGRLDKKRNTWGITYLSAHLQSQIEEGVLEIVGRDESTGVVEARYPGVKERAIKTVWHRTSHDAGAYGTDHLKKVIPGKTFPFPKSVYAVMDCLTVVCKGKPNAVILDYFSGSGTTAEAVMRINKKYPGNRSFIVCTNNESNIAEDITYPRIKNCIEGYGDLEKSDVNLRYYKTDFITKSVVSDDTRHKLVERATEMICVKENTFQKKYDDMNYKIYTNSQGSTGILYNLDYIDEFKKNLAKIGLNTSIYVFSLTNETFASDFLDMNVKYKLTPIPESILEVYRKLFS